MRDSDQHHQRGISSVLASFSVLVLVIRASRQAARLLHLGTSHGEPLFGHTPYLHERFGLPDGLHSFDSVIGAEGTVPEPADGTLLGAHQPYLMERFGLPDALGTSDQVDVNLGKDSILPEFQDRFTP